MSKIVLFSKLLFISLISLILISFSSCGKDKEDPKKPSNLVITITIVGQDATNLFGDGSGKIDIVATANDATSYKFELGNGAEQETTVGSLSYTYTNLGTQNYTIKVTVSNANGSISTSTQITVLYDPYASIKKALTNSTSKSWYWNHTQSGHIGQSSLNEFQPSVYIATPNEFESTACLYDDKMTFAKESNGQISFQLDNNGSNYFNKNEVFDALGSANPSQDACYNYSTSGTKTVVFSEATSGILNSTRISFSIANNGFMSYFLGNSTYEILSISDTEMHLRVIQDINGTKTAWYHKFTTNPPTAIIDFNRLYWADEFNIDGAPNTSYWNYEIGTGNNGWGNGEYQYYTNRPENVIVNNGLLKIIAKAESYGGRNYTSARIITKGKLDFMYGRIDIKAKLPIGSGTWPALWLLGSNISTVGWPACGEIDIMEHWGNNPGRVASATHTPSSYGNTINVGAITVSDFSTAFHVYSIKWTKDKLEFSLDGNVYYTYNPSVHNSNTWPFDANMFLIFNVAMGSTYMTVDPNFVQSSMEVDYVRVYR